MFKGYLDMLAGMNGLSGGAWNLGHGMGFGAAGKWWGDGGDRDEPHNGLDLAEYVMKDGTVLRPGGSMLVPAAGDGEVAAIVPDFLGRSVFMVHGPHGGGLLLSAYGHVVPAEGLKDGMKIEKGLALGTVSEYAGMPVPPHLHFSILVVPPGMVPDGLRWKLLSSGGSTRFLDPTELI